MIFYRVKAEYNNAPMFVGKKKGKEYWSVYVGGELFTRNEVLKHNLNPAYLEAVEVNRLQTHYAGPYRIANDDASITRPAVQPVFFDSPRLTKEAEEQIAKIATERPEYGGVRKTRPKRIEVACVRIYN